MSLESWILLFIGTCVAGFQIYTLKLLSQYSRNQKTFDQNQPLSKANLSGISVIVPIRGPVAGLKKSISSLLAQDYPGPLEFVFVFQDEKDLCILEVEKILEQTKRDGRHKIQILKGLKFLGLNPKNSNLVHGFRVSTQPWIFVCDADTCLPPSHLRRSMAQTQGDEKKYVTAVTVHEGAKTLGALLETISTNTSLITFFLLTYLNNTKDPGPINGAAYLFSKNLLEKAGGAEQILNVLTDDSVFERSFKKAGGYGMLAPDFVRVTLERQTLKGFVQRQFRWMLIAKCYFFPGMLVTPFLWLWQWLVLAGVFFHDPRLLETGFLLAFLRITTSFFYQILLGVPKVDWPKSLTLCLCDIIIPFLWIIGIPIHKVTWAGRELRVSGDGTLRPASN